MELQPQKAKQHSMLEAAHNLCLQMLRVGNISVTPCLKGNLCWSPHWRQLYLTSGGLWRGRAQSFLCTFLELEQTLKIHQWEVLWDVLYPSMKNVSLSSFSSYLQLNAGACHKHESTFVVIFLVRHENLSTRMHTWACKHILALLGSKKHHWKQWHAC